MEMNADSLHVALPIALKAFLERRVAEGRYGDVSEYISDLVRADEEQAARELLELELLKGLDSGEATPMTAEDSAQIRAEVRARLQQSPST